MPEHERGSREGEARSCPCVVNLNGDRKIMSNKTRKKNRKNRAEMDLKTLVNPNGHRLPMLCLIFMVSLYIFLLMVVYPFYMQNYFYDIGDAKWRFFSNISFFADYKNRAFYFPGCFIFIAAILVWYVIDAKVKKEKLYGFHALSIQDDIVATFLLLVSVSSILTPYKDTVVDGYQYWNMGLITQIALVIIYLLASRFWSAKKWEWYLWMAASWLVACIGVLNRLGQDPIGTLADKSNPQLIQFLSTIGQQTYFSNYVTVFIPIGIFVYWKARAIDVKIISGIYIFIMSMSLTASGNDSGFLALFAAMSILLWFSFKDNESINAVFEITLLILLGFKFLGLLQISNPDATALGGLSQRLTQGKETLIGIVAVAGVYGLVRYLEKKKELKIDRYEFIRKIYLGLVIGMFAFYFIFVGLNTVGMLPDSIAVTGEDVSATYFTFGDDWGNHRGAIWHIALMTLGDWATQDPLKLIFGAGPDCIIYELSAYHQNEILNNVGTELGIACVHNEWLNCLLGYGLLGGAAYMAIFVSAVRRSLKNLEANLPWMMCVVSYVIHNFFCYQNIIVTPMVFVMIGLIEVGARKAAPKEAEASGK